jgi:anaerobic selenocysteine-containing dehydrogenase
LDVNGGNRPWTERLTEASVELPSSSKPPLGAKEFPLFVEHYGEAQGMLLAEAIESGQVKAVFSIGMNLMMWPDSKRLEKALRSLELFTVCDFFNNPSVDAANVFFPAATHLERQALIFSGSGQIQYRPVAVSPRGEARGDTELVFEIAASLGLDHRFWNGNIHSSYEERLGESGVKLVDLLQSAGPVAIPIEPPEERAYESKGFGTPTGKIEFVSTLLEKAGHSGLPKYEEPKWSPYSAPDVAKAFPLVLTSGGRSKNYTHSQGRLLKTLREREPDPRIQIHPEDAKPRAIEEGDWVEVSSPLGAIEMRAQVTDVVQKGVVHAFHGWAGHNINEVIPDHLDPVSGFPSFKSSLCEVRKK